MIEWRERERERFERKHRKIKFASPVREVFLRSNGVFLLLPAHAHVKTFVNLHLWRRIIQIDHQKKNMVLAFFRRRRRKKWQIGKKKKQNEKKVYITANYKSLSHGIFFLIHICIISMRMYYIELFITNWKQRTKRTKQRKKKKKKYIYVCRNQEH